MFFFFLYDIIDISNIEEFNNLSSRRINIFILI